MLRCQGCWSQKYSRSSRRAESSFDCLLRCKRCGQLKRVNKLVAMFLRPGPMNAPRREAGREANRPAAHPGSAASSTRESHRRAA